MIKKQINEKIKYMLIAGIDEAGRGPSLGPMTMSVVLLEKEDEEKLIKLEVKDSKMLSPEVRTFFEPRIKDIAKEYYTVKVEVNELNELMNRYSLNEIEAMKAGYLLNQLKEKPELVLVDSPDIIAKNFEKRIRKYYNADCIIKTEHKADEHYPVVSAASILAKVARDNAVLELHKKFGDFGSGYPHDPKTQEFIKKYLEKHKKLPSIARIHWETCTRAVDERFQTKLF